MSVYDTSMKEGLHSIVETLPIPNRPNMGDRERAFREDRFLRRYLPSPCYLTSVTYANKIIANSCKEMYVLQLSSARALFKLREQPEAIPINEIMRLIDFSNDPGTRIVNQLVDKGLALRKPNPTSRRSYLVGITHHGVMACQALAEHIDESFDKLVDSIDHNAVTDTEYTHGTCVHKGAYEHTEDSFALMNITLNTSLERVTDYNPNCPLTLTQYRILSFLKIAETPCSFIEIRRFMYLRPNTLSAAVAKLCDLGLTERAQGTDRRTLFLKILPAGLAMIDQVAPLIYEEALRYFVEDSAEPSLEVVKHIIMANCRVSTEVLKLTGLEVY